nr:peptidase M42 [Clostridia bacterium]
MKYTVNTEYLLDVFKKIIDTPSPVGFYTLLNPVLEKLASDIGYPVTYDNRKSMYITLDGEDNSKSVLIGAHADTLGFMVRKIDGSGTLRFRSLGGGNIHSFEGETVTVHTRDGRSYTGLICCQSHSTHAFEDASTLARSENTLMILLDERVKSKDDVLKLGIRPGDYVSVDPRTQITPNGYIKSRYIDDKGGVACCYEALRYLKENNLKPKYRTIFVFPYT